MAATPRVYLNVDPTGCPRRNEEVCYEIWVPDGDCVRVVFYQNEWRFVRPFETWTSHDAGAPATRTENPLYVVVDRKKFRSPIVEPNAAKDVTLVDHTGATGKTVALNRRPADDSDANKDALRIRLGTRFSDSPVAFGVNVYSRERRSASNPSRIWSWTSAAVVPWSLLNDHGALFAMRTFMWSDKRMKTEVARMSELLIVQSRDVVMHGVVQRLDLPSCVLSVTQEYANPEFEALMRCNLTPEMHRAFKDEQASVRNSTFNTTLDGLPYAAGGATFMGGPMPEEFMGASAQAWYYYNGPVVTAGWLIQKLHQVAFLHCYDVDRNYVRDANAVINGELWKDNPSLAQRLLTNVVRIATMHATSSPYAEDGRDDPATGERKDSDSYSSALKVPGDCEDGAHAAYMVYMSVLFGDWAGDTSATKAERQILRALQQLAAYLGVPVCITGTSANPMRPAYEVDPVTKKRVLRASGGTHAYGAVVPFPRFVRALFGAEAAAAFKKNRTEGPYARFRAAFGYDCPESAEELEVSAIETTLFSTPLSGHHEHHPGVEREKYDIMREFFRSVLGERHCAAINAMYTFVLDEDCACHQLALKCFTDAHRQLFYTGEKDRVEAHPRTMRGGDAGAFSCTFAFWRPQRVTAESERPSFERRELREGEDPTKTWTAMGYAESEVPKDPPQGGKHLMPTREKPTDYIGVHRDELYRHEGDCGWELRVPVAMPERLWEEDWALIRSARAPFQPLVARVVDPQKDVDLNAAFAVEHAGRFRHDEPHIVVFIYDVAHVYDGGETVVQKMDKLCSALGATKHVSSMYDKCLVVVFTGIES